MVIMASPFWKGETREDEGGRGGTLLSSVKKVTKNLCDVKVYWMKLKGKAGE